MGVLSKKKVCQIFHQKKIQKVLMKIDEMVDVFLNSSNSATHAFFSLAPPSCYTLNLKKLTEVSKVSWSSQFSYKILWSSFEKKIIKDKLHFSEKTPPKSPGFLGLDFTVQNACWLKNHTLFWLWNSTDTIREHFLIEFNFLVFSMSFRRHYWIL